ncbi:MAG: SRPBCC domain-containing protein, partial [Solirubrobacteraceae bacterium]
IDFSMVERTGGAVYPVRFQIVELSEPELLVLASDPMPDIGLVHPMITRAVFEADGEDTLMTVTQTPHTDATQDGATAGWTESLDKLEKLLARIDNAAAAGPRSQRRPPPS